MGDDNMVCAMCNERIGKYEMCVTLSSGKRICERCIWDAMCNKYGQEGKQ